MDILKFPHEALFVKCKEVTVFGDELKVLLEAMWEAMAKAGGIGLSSNQVGLDYRMFTMLGQHEEKIFMVNPMIIKTSEAPAMMREGCLSAPGEFVILKERMSWVQVDYKNEKGQSNRRVFYGLQAVCVQHEIDHLDGKSHLMSKSIPRERRKQIYKKWGLK